VWKEKLSETIILDRKAEKNKKAKIKNSLVILSLFRKKYAAIIKIELTKNKTLPPNKS